ncbi:MAG: hypothetical protein K0R57_6645 [Paenibacillaceae bacterium]|jgi:hypothetical protein|nr:hypothetical protein [Paenibacillaceae bacterium]
MAKPLQVDSVWLERIAQSLEGITFGCVQIVVHEGRIVQVDKTERYRFGNETGQASVSSSSKRPKII